MPMVRKWILPKGFNTRLPRVEEFFDFTMAETGLQAEGKSQALAKTCQQMGTTEAQKLMSVSFLSKITGVR